MDNAHNQMAGPLPFDYVILPAELLRGDTMSREALTRRLFLQGSGTMAGSIMMRAGIPAFIAASQAACTAKEEAAVFEVLTNADAHEVIAIAARIFPTTDTPGATEAGAVYFFDKALGTIYADMLEPARGMLAGFQSGVASTFTGAKLFSDLGTSDQDDYLRSVERTPFFQGARFLTLAGIFGMSSYGGNRDDIGWKLIGMDSPPHAWTFPFGYYDTEYQAAQEKQNGE
jgi:gluconate 2-dehydrogenase gamma chain